MKFFSLYQLNLSIKNLIQGIGREFWVTAEVAQAQVGLHAYLELVQKEGDAIVAKSRATIWQSQLQQLRAKLGEEHLQQLLKLGTKLLLHVKVSYHEVHGIALAVSDIDPSYTLGELERRRQETIKTLEMAGLLRLQQALPLPMVPQRLAVVSSADAAGFGDFVNQLERNPYGYRFHVKLFPAAVQGERAEQEMLARLQEINPTHFDAVVVIRGGGARLDLEAFNGYALAARLAQMPLPVLTGIGHERDLSVCDLVARLHFPTPTAVADHLVRALLQFETKAVEAFRGVALQSEALLGWSMQALREQQHRLRRAAEAKLQREQLRLSNQQLQLAHGTRRLLERQAHRLELLEKRIELANPLLLLEKGYTLTLLNGQPLGNALPQPGDKLTTISANARIDSDVTGASAKKS